jgi:hypothetical protein
MTTERKYTDVELERAIAGDLPPDRAAAIERDATAADRARMDELRAEHAAFAGGIDVDEQVRRIEQRVARAAPPPRAPAWLRWAIPAGTLAMAAAVIAMIVMRRGDDDAPANDDDIAIKGDSVALTVHLQTATGSRVIGSGESIAPGDRIRFEVAAPRPGHIAVVAVDGAGKTTVYYPYGGGAAPAFDPTADRLLPGAIELDATPGDETIRVYFSRSPFTTDQIPADASTARIVLRKLPPK